MYHLGIEHEKVKLLFRVDTLRMVLLQRVVDRFGKPDRRAIEHSQADTMSKNSL